MSFVDEFDDLMIHSVTLTTKTPVLDAVGRVDKWVDNPPVEVRGIMKQLSSTQVRELELNGVVTAFRFITVSGWPGGLHSVIRYDNRDLVQSGEVLKRPGLDLDHDEVLLVAVNAVNVS